MTVNKNFERYSDSPTPPMPSSPKQLINLPPSPSLTINQSTLNDNSDNINNSNGNNSKRRNRSSSLILNLNDYEDNSPRIEDSSLIDDQIELNKRRQIYKASAKMAAVFFLSFLSLALILYFSWPEIEEQDKPALRIPKSFEQLQALNKLLKKYRSQQGFRILVCWTVIYLFLQAFSLPGSMYLSILGGAVWGAVPTLPLVCCTVATGASLCYLISASLGGIILALPPTTKSKRKHYQHLRLDSDTEPFLLNEESRSNETLTASAEDLDNNNKDENEEKLNWFDSFRLKLEHYQNKIRGPIERGDVWSYLILLRIAPLPPHWVLNLIAPHLGISLFIFWATTALGVAGVSTIHVTIGSGLDGMTSSEDFHLFSFKNIFGLGVVVLAALIPIGIRHAKKKDLDSLASIENEGFIPNDNNNANDQNNSNYPPSYKRNSYVERPAPASIQNRSRSSSRTILLDSTPIVKNDHKRKDSLSPRENNNSPSPSPQLILINTPPPINSPNLINFDNSSNNGQIQFSNSMISNDQFSNSIAQNDNSRNIRKSIFGGEGWDQKPENSQHPLQK